MKIVCRFYLPNPRNRAFKEIRKFLHPNKAKVVPRTGSLATIIPGPSRNSIYTRKAATNIEGITGTMSRTIIFAIANSCKNVCKHKQDLHLQASYSRQNHRKSFLSFQFLLSHISNIVMAVRHFNDAFQSNFKLTVFFHISKELLAELVGIKGLLKHTRDQV